MTPSVPNRAWSSCSSSRFPGLHALHTFTRGVALLVLILEGNYGTFVPALDGLANFPLGCNDQSVDTLNPAPQDLQLKVHLTRLANLLPHIHKYFYLHINVIAQNTSKSSYPLQAHDLFLNYIPDHNLWWKAKPNSSLSKSGLFCNFFKGPILK